MLPDASWALPDTSKDCFAREKFVDYRDDMGGVGSFMRVNRTLYVGRIHVSDDIEEIVARHFQEWGLIRTKLVGVVCCVLGGVTAVQRAQQDREMMEVNEKTVQHFFLAGEIIRGGADYRKKKKKGRES